MLKDGRFIIRTAWEGGIDHINYTETLSSALIMAAHYLRQSACYDIYICDTKTYEIYFDWTRPDAA